MVGRRLQLNAGPLYGDEQREVPVKGERGKLYDAGVDFFELDGNIVMILTPDAAIEVCGMCADRDELVFRIEGGIWHDPGFEARIDCIWDGADPPVDRAEASRNNSEAAVFIQEQSELHTAFVVSTTPITGWKHKQA